MDLRHFALLSTINAALIISCLSAHASDTFSDADKAFVAKVSQGGMYEVQLGKLAETKGATEDIKDQGSTEAHDHMLVGEKLKAIVEVNGMVFPDHLNAEFQARFDKISALPDDQFDAAYIQDMLKIHKADGAAFAKESTSGTNPDLKAFAAETYRIVQRHLGELGAPVH